MKRYLAAAMLLLALSGCGSSGSIAQLYTTTEAVSYTHLDVYKRQALQGKARAERR